MSIIWGCLWGNANWAETVLPVEVMGLPPHTEVVTLELSGGNSERLRLEAMVHNVSYRDKARIRVNGGSWITLWNDVPEVDVAEPDKSYGGFGGGFSTVRFSLNEPVIDLVAGQNTVEFQYFYKHPEHATAGYRVVRINILDEDGNPLIPEEAFVDDDPGLWTPPLDNPTDIAAGEAIWRTAELGMAAKCKDCHTDDGRDLKYFNVSNKTIIEQCVKSGFTELEGKQVASYIRSLPFDAPSQARPWNPPYQPGPGTDSRPVFEWAAGAGLDWVLSSDKEMLPYLFGAASQEEIDTVTDIRTDLNLREMPVAVQFPDWIHWIPRTHPKDVFGEDWWETEKGEKQVTQNWRNPHQAYHYLRNQFINDDLANSPDLVNVVDNQFQRNVLWWIGDARSGHPWTDKEGKNLDRAISRGFTAAEAKLHVSRWRAVKLWELFHTYDAEDKAGGIIPTAEYYQWPTNRFAVFQIAAHFIGDDRGTSAFLWEDLNVGTYFSSIWYQLQMVLNSGMRSGSAVAPVDWAYNFYHVNRLGERTGVHEPLRLVQNLIKCYQQRDRSGEPISKEVWSMREVSPWRLYSDFKGDQTTYNLLDTYGHGKELRLRILRSLLNEFVDRSNEYAPMDWPRTSQRVLNADNWYRLESSSYIPIEEPDQVTKFEIFSNQGAGDAIEADALYRMIPKLSEIGLEPSYVQELADWCASVWPLVDWSMWATDSDGDRLHDYWEGIRFNSLAWDAGEDPDGNGMNNLYDYANGIGFIEPSLASTISGSDIAFVYHRPTYLNGLSVDLERSPDMQSWNPHPGGLFTSVPMLEIYEQVTETHALPQNNSFYRLKVSNEENPPN